MKKFIAYLLLLCTALTLILPALADGISPKGYLVLGADLTTEQQKQVMEIFGIDNASEYSISYCTNEQEHKAFDNYLSPSVIGSKAVSSILMIPEKEGSGIQIESHHITYVTEEMIQSALVTSGVKDVKVIVAAPFDVSGTAALLGAMNAYGEMTGSSVDDKNADAAVDELVTTSEIAEALGDKETAVELMALLKQYLAEHGDEVSDEELKQAIDAICVELNISLDDSMKDQIISLLRKLQHTDIDMETFRQQAGELYDRVSGLMKLLPGGDKVTPQGAMGFLQTLFGGLLDWVKGLLGS